MKTNEAEKILGVKLAEVDKVSLKKAFRTKSFLVHPDHGGSEKAFVELQDAYEALRGVCGDAPGDVSSEVEKIDGKPVSEYGNGYPITEAARACEICSGKGYKAYESTAYDDIVCHVCNGSGLFSYPCRKCGGSGRYKVNGEDRGECNLCGGSGRFYPENKRRARFDDFWSVPRYIPGTARIGQNCRACNGSGNVAGKRVIGKTYHACHECKGVGEVKMWNPVLHRGLLSGGVTNG